MLGIEKIKYGSSFEVNPPYVPYHTQIFLLGDAKQSKGLKIYFIMKL